MKQFWKHWQFTGSYKIPTPYERLKFYNLIFIILARNELINIYIYIYILYIYTNDPNNEGIKAIETTPKRKNLPTRVIINFLKLILTLKNFIFNCTNSLQIKQCGMGTKCVPSYANIFMGIFEVNTH